MTFKKIPMKGGLEYDAFTGWRRVLCYMGRPGLRKWVKRKYNKRMRQEGKKRISINLIDYYGR